MTVKVKICGITNADDAFCAAEAGADMLGLIFVAKSPRYVTPQQAKRIVDELAEHCAVAGMSLPRLVGVFVDEAPEDVATILELAGLNYAQLHGSEPPNAVDRLHGRAFKAIRPRPGEDVTETAAVQRFAALGVPHGPRVLMDAYSSVAHGGTGELSDWAYAAVLAREIDGFVLAGGLTPKNVAAAIATVHPWAVDTSSGVEREPGRKDHDAVRRFIAAAKGTLA